MRARKPDVRVLQHNVLRIQGNIGASWARRHCYVWHEIRSVRSESATVRRTSVHVVGMHLHMIACPGIQAQLLSLRQGTGEHEDTVRRFHTPLSQACSISPLLVPYALHRFPLLFVDPIRPSHFNDRTIRHVLFIYLPPRPA